MRYLSLCMFCLAALAETDEKRLEFTVIANPSVEASSISTDELRGVYLETKLFLSDGSRADPVLIENGVTHTAFLRECVGKTELGLLKYYRSLVFTGKGSMPRTFRTEAEVVAYVARSRGAVAYVSSRADLTGVKRLAVK